MASARQFLGHERRERVGHLEQGGLDEPADRVVGVVTEDDEVLVPRACER
jgi:hypothetical protein